MSAASAVGGKGPKSLIALFEGMVASAPQRVATKQKRNGVWVDTTWSEMGARARALSDGLAALGAVRGDRIALLADTSTEWILASSGILGAGGVVVPIYQSNKPHEVQYIVENSGARWIFCDTEAQAAKVREVRSQLPELRGVIRFVGPSQDPLERTLEEVEALGVEWRKGNEGAHAARVAAVNSEDPACFIYTSGTTGNPKGVVLTNANWTYEAEVLEPIGLVEPDDLVLLFLPMAHSFAQVMMALWFRVGCSVAMVESIEKIVDNAAEVKPTVMPSVPRIFEKAYNAVVSKGLATPGIKGKFFRMALAGLDGWMAAQEQGRAGGGGLGLLIGKKLVFPKLEAALKERFGGRMRRFISGGAPLSPKINWFFNFCGLEILEGYGLTETSAGTFVNRPGKNRIGTVGPPIPGTEVKIAPDGEVLIRGGGVLKEYFRNPAATAEAFQNGWFCTGDIGVLDEAGCLRITDRKKDIIVTAGGKNVAPQNLENDLKTEPFVSQVVVHGDKRKFLSALVTLNEENIRKWAADNHVQLAPQIHEDPQVRARVQAAIDQVNAKQASYSTIKKFAILARDFTQEAGEMTPTLKVKRKVVAERYRALLDGFYTE